MSPLQNILHNWLNLTLFKKSPVTTHVTLKEVNYKGKQMTYSLSRRPDSWE